MFKDLDPLLHSQLRLAVISHLISNGTARFKDLRAITKATSGNLSVQIKKLEEAQYINVAKTFLNNYPHTSINITEVGITAFESYVKALKGYIK